MDEGTSVGSESESDGGEDELDRALERIVARVNNSNPSGNTPATAGGNEMLGLVAMMVKRDKQREKERKEERKLEAERLRQQEKKWESLLTKSGKDGDAGKKRKKDEDWKSEEKELFKASVDIEDDGHEILCWKVRNHLVTPNGKPEDWWKGLPVVPMTKDEVKVTNTNMLLEESLRIKGQSIEFAISVESFPT